MPHRDQIRYDFALYGFCILWCNRNLGLRRAKAEGTPKSPLDLGHGLRMHKYVQVPFLFPGLQVTVRSIRFQENNCGWITYAIFFIVAWFSLLYHAGIFILESVIFILPDEVGSEIDFNFYKLRG